MAIMDIFSYRALCRIPSHLIPFCPHQMTWKSIHSRKKTEPRTCSHHQLCTGQHSFLQWELPARCQAWRFQCHTRNSPFSPPSSSHSLLGEVVMNQQKKKLNYYYLRVHRPLSHPYSCCQGRFPLYESLDSSACQRPWRTRSSSRAPSGRARRTPRSYPLPSHGYCCQSS